MAGYANTSVGRCTDAIGAIVGADGVTTCENVCIALVALTADLYSTHIWCGAIALGRYQ